MRPEKPKEYERKKIENMLAELSDKPLGLVVAPSGYGKTTAVRSFFAKHSECRHLWLSLGSEEVDEVWVWNRICDKCKDFNEKLYVQMKELSLPESVQEMDYFVKMLRGMIKEPLCIILDDYHECRGEAFNRLIAYLTEEDLPYLHILLIGQMYPDIPYGELYLKDLCVLIDQRVLSLTREESGEIFKQNGVELSKEELDHMEKYTDGWIAAVYLLLIEYKRNGQFDRFTNVTNLLKTAVFDKLSDTMQEMCAKMSLFDRFASEEAAYVSECELYPSELIDFVEKFGFMQFDVQSQGFQMHMLLRTMASTEFNRRGYDRKRCYIRCAQWNEKKQRYITAIMNYSRAGEFREIFRILSGEARYEVFDQAPAIIGEIFESAPAADRVSYPAAYLTWIYEIVLKDRQEKGKELLTRAKEEFARFYEGRDKYDRLKGELLIIESAAQFNDIERVTAFMREAKKTLKGETSVVFNKPLLTCGSPQMTMLYQKEPGELQRTVLLEKEYAEYYMYLIGGVKDGWDELFDAEYAYLTGELDRALELALQVKEKARFRRQTCIIISSYYIELWCLIYQGKRELLDRRMRELAEEMRGIARSVLVTDYELAYSRICVLTGRIDQMSDWIRNFELEKCSHIARSIRSGCITYGMILYMTGQWTLLDAIAGDLLVPYETARHVYVEICGWLYKAVAACHLEGMDSASEYLKKAVALAKPDGIKPPFIERSAELEPVFEHCLRKDPFYLSLKPYFKQWRYSLRLFEKEKKAVILTAREKELLTLVKEGCRNSDISERMNIALVTVEKSLTSIYRKLGVSNRAAAIAKAEELHIK